MKKLYVVTRLDLPPAQQAVQAMHAAVNVAYSLGVHAGNHQMGHHPDWEFPVGPYISVLAVENSKRLEGFIMDGAIPFTDPDVSDQICAVAMWTEKFNARGAKRWHP